MISLSHTNVANIFLDRNLNGTTGNYMSLYSYDSWLYNYNISPKYAIDYVKGRIYSKKTLKRLSGWKVKKGKGYIQSHFDGKPRLHHRVIWENYHHEEIPQGMHIHHVDGDETNNAIRNLKLVTPSDNNKFKAIVDRIKKKRKTAPGCSKEMAIHIPSDDDEDQDGRRAPLVISLD